MCIFDFSLPIGWDELGVIATSLAVVIALVANSQSKKQIASALEIQEQAKNIDLLDKRVSIIEKVEKNSQVPLRMIRLLFSEEIVEEFIKWCSFKTEKTNAEQEITYYWALCRDAKEAGKTEENVREIIQEYEDQIDSPNSPKGLEDEFRQFCAQNAFNAHKIGGASGFKMYNYYELNKKAGECQTLAEEAKKSLLNHMELYVERGLEPLSKRKTRKCGKT